MEEQSRLLIDKKLLLILTGLGYVLIVAGIIIKSFKGDSFIDVRPITTENILFDIGVVTLVAVWVVTLMDLYRVKLKYKFLWLIGMIAFPITPLVYLLRVK